jgi:hypothetical protein
VNIVSGNLVLQFSGNVGDIYTVETNGVLDNPAGWGKFGNFTVPAGGVLSVTNPVGTGDLFIRTRYPSY